MKADNNFLGAIDLVNYVGGSNLFTDLEKTYCVGSAIGSIYDFTNGTLGFILMNNAIGDSFTATPRGTAAINQDTNLTSYAFTNSLLVGAFIPGDFAQIVLSDASAATLRILVIERSFRKYE